ncbi:MAG: cytochrome b N-terminal domain-containing protein [Phycisphaerales bacterium]|nr:MAG: cytochrome b N-terminal domain-containing protein [Phycisphaerales bacterium]
MGLGIMTTVLFLILAVTGILLMFYYKPSVETAYDSIKDIHYVVPTGRIIRNVHRLSAQGMVVLMILHMARVFYTGAYKSPREFNWVVGMLLLIITLGLSFTGYLLPWDQLAYWGVTIGSGIAGSPRDLTDALGITQYFDPGGLVREIMLGAHMVGQEALIRFYTLHVIVLPIALVVVLGVHFWRIRKDGGLARPVSADPPVFAEGVGPEDAPTKSFGLMAVVRERTPATDKEIENTVPSWPRVFRLEAILTMVALLIVVGLSLFIDAPLEEQAADPPVPLNPAKASWYFLALQELVSYSAFGGGMVIPGIIIVSLLLIPFLDREEDDVGIWFGGRQGRRITVLSVAYAVVVCVGVLAFTINFGWLRNWLPELTQKHVRATQIVIMLFNPGMVFVVASAIWSLGLLRLTNSTRMASVGLLTCALVFFIILTYFAAVHRGPNWVFYWSQADWPVIEH